MSRVPSPDGVAGVINKVLDLVALEKEIYDIEVQLPRLEQAKKDLATLNRVIIKDLEEMDVKSCLNFGWERRFTWFLKELVRQVKNFD